MSFKEANTIRFSDSVNDVLESLGNSQPVSLSVIIKRFQHPEDETINKLFTSTTYSFLEDVISRSGVLYTGEAWGNLAFQLLELPPNQNIISGRMFLIACCIALHTALYNRGRASSKIDLSPEDFEQIKEFAQAVLPFIETLVSELVVMANLSLDNILSPRGKEEYSDLKRHAPSITEDFTGQQNEFGNLKNRLHSDDYNIDDEDILGYDLHASNLFNILTDKQTKPPLNIGILAPWGRGKTTLMRKIEEIFVGERDKLISEKNLSL